MRILREHLLLCILITLLKGNVAKKYPLYYDTLMQNGDVSQNDDSIDYRLPKDVIPNSYDIQLIPNFDDFTFQGIAKIEAVALRATKNITLHVGNSIIVKKAQSTIFSFLVDPNLSNSYDNITEKYTISLSETLPEGGIVLINFEYNGIISDGMTGFYRSSYLDENKQIQWLAATQFETTHARQAFPCFDEPSFKAKFTITLARDANYKTISNMPLQRSQLLKPGVILDTYVQSISMPTYLVAFVIANAEFDNFIKEGDNFAIWSKPSTINQTRYAWDIGTQALALYATKFNEDYALTKMDMVAIPDFAAGAMENWGLVTYRETYLLYDEEESSAVAEQNVASVICHELAHMWFGNLVTPEWWSYLWLSEAFARYFEYFGTAEIKTDWKMEQQFVVEQHQSALLVDSFESSLPMTREVSSKSQVAGAGDTITYNKGGSIVRMMSFAFGNDVFENALRNYIQNNKEKGLAQPDDLWDAIQNQVDNEPDTKSTIEMNVNEIMDTWTTKAGYPIVTVTIDDDGKPIITQKRFLLRSLDETLTDTTWFVPLTYATQSNPDFDSTIPRSWFNTSNCVLDDKIDPNEWVIFNIQSSGFYRVNYDDCGWQNIFDALQKNLEDIHVINRAAIVDDLFNLARAGYLNYDIVLEGLLYLQKETEYLPFKAAFNGLKYLNKGFTGHFAHSFFKMYVRSLINGISTRLGYEDEENDDRLRVLLRQEVNNWLCNFDDDECVNTYTEKFNKWRADGSRIKPNERPTAYCTAIRHGTSDDWEFLWQEYLSSNYAADQIVILNALGCTQNITLLEKYLNFAITDYSINQIRKQDSTSVFAAVYNSGLIGAQYVLDFVENYHENIEKYYGGQNTIASILNGASQRLSTRTLVDKFETLINKMDFEPIQKSLQNSLKMAKNELEWFDTYTFNTYTQKL